MFCTSCGGQIRDGAKFCIYCGAPQKAKTKDNNLQEPSFENENQFGQVDDWSSQDGDWTEADNGGGFQENEPQDTEPAASGLLVLQDCRARICCIRLSFRRY